MSKGKVTLDVAWCAFYELKLLAVVQQFRDDGKTDIKMLWQLLNRVACELFSKWSGASRVNPTVWHSVESTIDGRRLRK